jgi:hypothetical protein
MYWYFMKHLTIITLYYRFLIITMHKITYLLEPVHARKLGDYDVKRDREISVLMLCIMQLCVTEISMLELQHGRNVQIGSHSEGKILAVIKVLEVQTSHVTEITYAT